MIIIPSSKRGIITPRRRSFAGFIAGGGGGGLNILNRQWGDMNLPGPSFGMRGRVGWDKLDAQSGIVLESCPLRDNIILNCGLDLPAAYSFADCFQKGHLSTDANAQVATDNTMTGWAKTNTGYGSGDGSMVVNGDVVTLTRSFVFAAKTGDATFTKFYSSQATGATATPFNEKLFDTPLVLSNGQQGKVTMALDLTITPHTKAQTYSTAVLTNGSGAAIAGTTGSARIPYFRSMKNYSKPLLSYPYTSGQTWDGYSLLEPSTAVLPNHQGLFVSTQDSLIAAAETAPNAWPSYAKSSVAASLSSYTSGAYSRSKVLLADLNDCNGAIRSLGIYSDAYFPGVNDAISCLGYQFLFDQPFAKLNTQKLAVNFNFTWGRA